MPSSGCFSSHLYRRSWKQILVMKLELNLQKEKKQSDYGVFLGALSFLTAIIILIYPLM